MADRELVNRVYRDALDEPEVADLLAPILEAAGAEGVTPSMAARKARISTATAARSLEWMVANDFALATGNGAWTRYHAR